MMKAIHCTEELLLNMDIDIRAEKRGWHCIYLAIEGKEIVEGVDFIGYESIEIEDVIVSDNSVDLSLVLLEPTKPGTDVLIVSKD